MTCDECKEQVLDLIEREALDPEGVREVLARCPECRALFEEMKAGLSLADRLPRVEPPAEIDATILRAARARKSVKPLKRRWFRSPEWAVAAVALLAVGVGVWAIPRGEDTKPTAELAAPEDLERLEVAQGVAEESLDETEAAPPVEVAFADRGGAGEPAASKAAQRPRAKSVSPESRPQAMRRRSKADGRDDAKGARAASAPATADPAAIVGSSAGADIAVAEQVEALPQAQKKETAELSQECARRIARVERRKVEDDPSEIAPKDALAIGECYRESGDLQKARLWLERALMDDETKERATRALRELGND